MDKDPTLSSVKKYRIEDMSEADQARIAALKPPKKLPSDMLTTASQRLKGHINGKPYYRKGGGER